MTQNTFPSLLAEFLERLQSHEESHEALDLEFKAARGGLPKDIWPTVSAFANTQGGWIVLGVAEGPHGLSIEGVPHASEMLQNFTNLMRNRQKLSYPVCGPSDVSVQSLAGKDLVVIRVPAAPRRNKPVFIDGNPDTGTYVRGHTGDYHCSEHEVRRMMRDASDEPADAAVLGQFTLQDLDPESLARYRRLHLTVDSRSPRNAYEDRRFLEAIGGYRRDRHSGAEGLTVAGLLMFGVPEALREWRGRHLIDFRILPPESEEGIRWTDRVVWEGNLFGAYEAIYPKLVDGRPVPFRLQGATRIDEGPLHEAVREALVNLLVHADYAERDASLITRSPSGYLFRNAGRSRIPVMDLLSGDRSDPRNPSLVRMFRYIGLAEEAGTGMPKIVRAWRSLGFGLPDIDVANERYEFALTLRYVHFIAEEDRTWLRSMGDEWTEAEQLALVLARHEEVDNPRLRQLTGQHSADTTKVLSSLRNRGLLELIGWGRGARYQLGPAALAALIHRVEAEVSTADQRGTPSAVEDVAVPSTNFAANSGDLTANSGGFAGNSGDLTANSGGFAGNSGDFQRNSGGSGANSGGFQGNSGDLWAELQEIARTSRESSYLPAATFSNLLVQLCARRSLSLRELAELLGRTQDHVRKALSPLVASGQVTYLYPDRPNHPQQKYTIPSSSEVSN